MSVGGGAHASRFTAATAATTASGSVYTIRVIDDEDVRVMNAASAYSNMDSSILVPFQHGDIIAGGK